MNREQLAQDISDGLQVPEMASKYGRSPITIRQWLWKCGLKVGRVNDYLRVIDLSPNQKSMVLGNILGDGYITPKGALYDEHGIGQRELVEWRARILGPLVLRIRTVDKKFGVITRYETIVHPHFKQLRAEIYVDGIKRIPQSVVDRLDLFALANWYMDDGTYFNRKQVRFLLAGNTPEEDVLRVRDYLNGSWDMKCKEWKNNRQNVWAITARYAPSKRLLATFCELDLPKCMRHKLGLNP